MQIAGRCILLLVEDAQTAAHLVSDLERARADLVVAAHSFEAIERLRKFTFAAAVIDYRRGGQERKGVAVMLAERGIPLLVLAEDRPPEHLGGTVVNSREGIVPALASLLAQ
ncbi:MAG: hypothetical protein F9K29_11070 [Hyphomicrobiaceae bacterium]|nr:MAG: hypothetical protein F9K29_11070 [Hyphomicrobiaceae bacterium]